MSKHWRAMRHMNLPQIANKPLRELRRALTPKGRLVLDRLIVELAPG